MTPNPQPKNRIRTFVLTAITVLMIFFALFIMQGASTPTVSAQIPSCVQVASPRDIPSPKILTFDDQKDGTLLGSQYQAGYGVVFPTTNSAPFVHDVSNEADTAATKPNVARNAIIPGVPNSPLEIDFTFPRTHVGMYVGNGSLVAGIMATLTAYNGDVAICQMLIDGVPVPHTFFAGIYDSKGSITRVTLAYNVQFPNQESIDNLYFAPGLNPNPRQAAPRWTPIPPPRPTPGPAPTATPVFPAYAMHAYVAPIGVVLDPIPPDFGIFNIEITQGIQCLFGTPAGCVDNSEPLVLSKSTVVRVYLKAANTHSVRTHIPVRLHLHAFSTDYTINGYGNTTLSVNQATHDAAEFYFTVYSGALSSVQVWAEVDPDHLYATTYTNNHFPLGGGFNTYNFNNRRTFTVAGERLNYHPAGYTGTNLAGGWAVNGGAAQWWNQVMPLSDNAINYFVRSGYLDWTTSLGSGDGQHSLIQALNFMWIKENALSWWFGTGPFTGARHVYGWAPSAGYSGGHADMPIYPHAGGLGVVGIGSDAAGTSTDNPGSGALIFGHELTHDYNIFHTNTSDACGSNDSNSNFPYSNSSIQAFGFNTITGKIYNPSLTHDLMSYCPSGGSKQGWIAPFTWGTMYSKLSALAAAQVKGPSIVHPLQTNVLLPTAFTQSLVVNATIYNPATTPPVPGKFGNLTRINGGLTYIPPLGQYYVELHNAPDGGGAVLAGQSFDVNFNSEYVQVDPKLPPPPFPPTPTGEETVNFIMPWIDGTQSIVLRHNTDIFETRNVSQNAPQVSITAPLTDATWDQHTTQPLSWNGSDPDGDALSYSIMYSNDSGVSWVLLVDGLSATTYAVDVDLMAGASDVRFRVVASDGVNTGFDETPANITIPNHAPDVTISDPIGGSFHLPGDLIVFHGIGVDMEDGTLAAGSLVWSDNLQGGLGIGQTVPINNLTPGKHTITLTATDSYGVSSTTSVSIFVDYPMYLPTVRR